jgi:hypothetical protein
MAVSRSERWGTSRSNISFFTVALHIFCGLTLEQAVFSVTRSHHAAAVGAIHEPATWALPCGWHRLCWRGADAAARCGADNRQLTLAIVLPAARSDTISQIGLAPRLLFV